MAVELETAPELRKPEPRRIGLAHTAALDIPPEMQKIWDERADPIVMYPDPVLRKPARPVVRPGKEARALVDRMRRVMSDANGVGLAAPQIGVLQRVIVYKLPEEDQPFRAIINPKIVTMKGEQEGPEGCLSLPLLQGDVKRAYEIVVKGMDSHGRPMRRRATAFEARVIQHEVDHLDGILFIDKADPDTLHWLVEEEIEEDAEPAMRD